MALRVGIIAGLLGALAAAANGQNFDEFQVKSAFLYNLAKFVKWPDESFKRADDPIVVCILGQGPMATVMDATVRGKLAEGRPFVIRPIPDERQANACHIVFVSSSMRARLTSILSEIKGNGVLTVGETDAFIPEGGMVNFKLDAEKVRIQINVEAAARRQLQISSKLLSLAEIVKK